MFKRITMFMLVMILASATAFAAAPDRTNRVDWGVEVGGAFPGSGIESGVLLQSNLAYGMTEWIAIGAEIGWWESDTDASNNEGIGLGQVLADFILRVPNLNDQIVPYGILGLGWAVAYLDNDPANPTQEGADSSDSSFAYKIGGGIDWFVSDQWMLNLELAHNGNSPSLAGASTQDTDFTSLVVGAKYLF